MQEKCATFLQSHCLKLLSNNSIEVKVLSKPSVLASTRTQYKQAQMIMAGFAQ